MEDDFKKNYDIIITVHTTQSTVNNALTVKVGVRIFSDKGSGSKIYELYLEGLEVDEDILVFNVSVNNPLSVARQHGLHDLKHHHHHFYNHPYHHHL